MPNLIYRWKLRWVTGLLTYSALSSCTCFAYDPLISNAGKIQTQYLEIVSSQADRVIPVLVSIPNRKSVAPAILFSHGLGGSREAASYLREHWTARGYITIFLQHPGSDSSLWLNVSRLQAGRQLRNAASRENLELRVTDVTDVLDILPKWNSTPAHPLFGRIDIERVGLSGHSFGARTTQIVIGQKDWLVPDKKDSRIKAAVLFSPSSPRLGSAETAFGSIDIPCLLLTGTRDVVAIGSQTAESRLAVFPALQPGGTYQLVLHKATNSAFTDGVAGRDSPRNPNHHRAIKAITTAFWDAHLQDNARAKGWLNTNEVRNVLEEKDDWQAK